LSVDIYACIDKMGISPVWTCSEITNCRTLVQSAVLQSYVVCVSVRLSVMLVDCDHIGWNSSKIISRLVSVGHSLSADPNIMDLLQGEQPEILAQSDPPPCWFERWRHSIANCGRMVTHSTSVTMESL